MEMIVRKLLFTGASSRPENFQISSISVKQINLTKVGLPNSGSHVVSYSSQFPSSFQLLVPLLVPRQTRFSYQAAAGSRSSPFKSWMLEWMGSCACSKALECSEDGCGAQCAAAKATTGEPPRAWGMRHEGHRGPKQVSATHHMDKHHLSAFSDCLFKEHKHHPSAFSDCLFKEHKHHPGAFSDCQFKEQQLGGMSDCTRMLRSLGTKMHRDPVGLSPHCE